ESENANENTETESSEQENQQELTNNTESDSANETRHKREIDCTIRRGPHTEFFLYLYLRSKNLNEIRISDTWNLTHFHIKFGAPTTGELNIPRDVLINTVTEYFRDIVRYYPVREVYYEWQGEIMREIPELNSQCDSSSPYGETGFRLETPPPIDITV